MAREKAPMIDAVRNILGECNEIIQAIEREYPDNVLCSRAIDFVTIMDQSGHSLDRFAARYMALKQMEARAPDGRD